MPKAARCAFVVLLLAALAVIAADKAAWNWNTDDKKNGPDAWPSLFTKSCAEGQQSPIALGDSGTPRGTVSFHYRVFRTHVQNDGHKILVAVPVAHGGGYIEIQKGAAMRQFYLAEFHVHAPSEHTIEGDPQAMEVHLVHKTADGKAAAAVGILLKRVDRDGNALVHTMISTAPNNGAGSPVIEVDPRILLAGTQGQGRYYNYSGSLTTPSCDPVSEWVVSQQLSAANAEDVTRLHELIKNFLPEYNPTHYPDNNRPLQKRMSQVGIIEAK